ncbi:hypothetical protein [Sinorhizobium fredii]|uniref:hypothetical protein n=1 Tax=Rhizobium fredii TaxID=380 RepID=UPI00130D652C|nr:hypothetical protein [Sinorhizobium fredii]
MFDAASGIPPGVQKRKGRPIHHGGRPSRNKGDAGASPAGRFVADHARELEEEERSSGLYRSEIGHLEGGGEQMTNYLGTAVF